MMYLCSCISELFLSINETAARLRLAATEKAEAEKILQIKRAEGDAESKYLAGLGIARQRQAIVDGLRDSVLAFSENVPGTSAKDVMDMVLVAQYFDTMKEIGASSKSSSVDLHPSWTRCCQRHRSADKGWSAPGQSGVSTLEDACF